MSVPRSLKMLLTAISLSVGSVAVLAQLANVGQPSSPPNAAPTSAPVVLSNESGPTAADRINYFLAIQKWYEREQERRVAETANKPAVMASLRSSLREIRELAFDTDDLPPDFRQAFLRVLSCSDEAVNILEQVPDLEDPWAIVGFGVNLGKDYLFGSKDALTALKERAERLAREARDANAAMDDVAIRHGARTDWQAMPRVVQVVPGSHAARLGVRSGDFFFTYEDAKLFRRLHHELLKRAKGQGKSEIEVRFLTPHGVCRANLPIEQPIGVQIDTACAQPPVVVKLEPYLFSEGFYVHVINCSADTNLDGVSVRYIDVQGKSREQPVGSLMAKARQRIDPHAVNWRVEKGETIAVGANGFVERLFNTSLMVK